MTADQLYLGVGMVVVWMGLASALIAIALICFCVVLASIGPVADWARAKRAAWKRKPYTPYTWRTDAAAMTEAERRQADGRTVRKPEPSNADRAAEEAIKQEWVAGGPLHGRDLNTLRRVLAAYSSGADADALKKILGDARADRPPVQSEKHAAFDAALAARAAAWPDQEAAVHAALAALAKRAEAGPDQEGPKP